MQRVEITEAYLELYVEIQPKIGLSEIKVFLLESDWKEMQATWYKSYDGSWWDKEGGDFNMSIVNTLQTPSSIDNLWLKFNVTRHIQSILNGENPNFGFIILMNSGISLLHLTSSESNRIDKRPKLTLNIIHTDIKIKKNDKTNDIKIINKGDLNFIQISKDRIENIKMFSLNGKLILKSIIGNKNSLVLLPRNIGRGIYVLEITGSKEVCNRTIQIK